MDERADGEVAGVWRCGAVSLEMTVNFNNNEWLASEKSNIRMMVKVEKKIGKVVLSSASRDVPHDIYFGQIAKRVSAFKTEDYLGLVLTTASAESDDKADD